MAKKAATEKAPAEEVELKPSKKEIADGQRYAELAATKSKNQLKKMTCFAFAKGKCKKGDDCPFLHAGAAPNKKLNVGKRKRLAAKEEQGQDQPSKKQPKQSTWLCPKCGNKNWARRDVCNGHACQDQFRPDHIKPNGAAPGTTPHHRTPHAAVVAGGVTTGGGCRLFLRKLAYDINEEKVRDFFQHCGEVKDIHWLTDKRNGQINAGFIEFADEDGARKGVAMSGKPCCGRPIRIEYAKAASEENPNGDAAGDAQPAAAKPDEAEADKEGSDDSDDDSDSGSDSDDAEEEEKEEWSDDDSES
jgi:hypothetical protein